MPWREVLAAEDVAPGAVVAIVLDDADLVVWRTAGGALGVLPRACPHLDSDLADEGRVLGQELVCQAHGWCFDTAGLMGKRNARGRFDAKGAVEAPSVRECSDRIEVSSRRREDP